MKLTIVVFSGFLLACGSAAAQIVKMDGSSTVYPISEAVAEDFQKAKKNAVKVTVGISGTGGGFKKFCRGETDISNASRPILEKEMVDCRAAGMVDCTVTLVDRQIRSDACAESAVRYRSVAHRGKSWPQACSSE